MTAYTLVDEPTPSPWAHYGVRPFWIAVGLVSGGAWLAFGWFIFNAYAIGSPTKRREIGLVLGYLVGALLVAAVVAFGLWQGLPTPVAAYLLLTIEGLKLSTALVLVVLQARIVRPLEHTFAPLPLLVLGAGGLLRLLVIPDGHGPIALIVRAVLA